MRPSPSLFLRTALFALLPLCLGACLTPSGCSSSGGADAGAAVTENLTPLPAPEGLLADLFLPAPDATWTKARGIVGGPAIFMPQSFGGLVATLLHLPPTIGAEIDEKVPTLGVLLRKDGEPITGAIGIHVKAGDRFVDQLTRGPDARFVAKLDESSRINVLSPKSGGETPIVLGVLGNYLLVAPKLADLNAAGPYVVRTLPTRPLPNEDLALEIPASSLGGPVLEALKRRWADTKSKIESSIAPLIPFTGMVDATLGVLSDAKQARVTVELDASAVHARVTLTPKPGEGPAAKALAEMTTGDTRPLLELPEDALVGMMWRESVKARSEDVPAEVETLSKLLGKEVPDEDKTAIRAALSAEAEARGDWVTLGVTYGPTGPNAMVRTLLRDEEKMSKALRQIALFAKLPSVKAGLKEAEIGVEIGKTVVENLAGDVQRVRFERLEQKSDKEGKGSKTQAKSEKKDDKAAKGEKKDDKSAPVDGKPANPLSSSIELLYLVTPEALFGAAGSDPKEGLRRVVKVPSEATLGSNGPIKSALEALGSEVSFALVLDPIRSVAARAGKAPPLERAPVVLAIGKKGSPSQLEGRLDIAAVAIQELIKHRGAF